ncbi:MAG: tyrosine-type recombinase/integrase [Planctomycetaceae bacterium]|nr:tyrosine-type recombinase/integrase [Planctomycetaceae bacterium]
MNKRIARVKQVFKWGVENEHVPPHLQTCLSTVRGLKAGRSKSLESNPVTPVPQRDLEETIKHLTTTLADLFRVQLLTGMRPSEERLMLIGDLDTSRDVWLYCPDQHKTRDHGKRRMIWIGPQAQAIIQKHLSNDRRRYVFPSCRRRQNQPYTLNGYLSSIRKACIRAGVPVWTPGQLRHNAAFKIRSHYRSSRRMLHGSACAATTNCGLSCSCLEHFSR